MRKISLVDTLRALKQRKMLGLHTDLWFSSPLFFLLLLLFVSIL